MENFCKITKKQKQNKNKKNLIIVELKCYSTEKRNIQEIFLKPENPVNLRE